MAEATRPMVWQYMYIASNIGPRLWAFTVSTLVCVTVKAQTMLNPKVVSSHLSSFQDNGPI